MSNKNYPYMTYFCTLLIEHMERGFSFDTFHGTLRYPKHVVDSWLVEKPTFIEAKGIADNARRKTLEAMLFSKEISLETFKYLTENEESEIERASASFDDKTLIQARERFAK